MKRNSEGRERTHETEAAAEAGAAAETDNRLSRNKDRREAKGI